MRVAIYARVSTEKQEEEKTVESQIVELENLAKEKNHIVIDKYVDNGYSGTLLARPHLDRLRDDAVKQLFEAVLIHSPDRLARRYVYQELVIDELKSHGVQVIFLNRPQAETPEDQLLLGVQGLFAEYERTKIVERTRRGRLHRAKNGHIVGNLPPFGYELVKKADSKTGYAHYRVNEAEARIVRLIFDLLIGQQMTMYGLILELNKRGIRPRKGKRWARSSLSKILRNQSYIGTTFYNKYYGTPSNPLSNGQNKGNQYHRTKNTSRRLRPKEEWIPIPVSAIIDSHTFEMAQRQLEANSRFSERNTKLSYLLRGLIRCGKDGRLYSGVPFHGRPFYRCSGKNKLVSDKGCKSSSVSAGIIEPIVWQAVGELLHNPQLLMQQLKARRQRKLKQASFIDTEIQSTEKELMRLKLEEDRVLEAYKTGVISLEQLKEQNSSFQSKRQQLTSDKERFLSQKTEHASLDGDMKQKVIVYLSRIEQALERFGFNKKQQFLRQLLNEICINDRYLLIRGNIRFEAIFNLCSQPFHARSARSGKNHAG